MDLALRCQDLSDMASQELSEALDHRFHELPMSQILSLSPRSHDNTHTPS